jgi:hypothetical protein
LIMPEIEAQAFQSGPEKIRNSCRNHYGSDPEAVEARIQRFIENT